MRPQSIPAVGPTQAATPAAFRLPPFDVPCPICQAPPGQSCTFRDGKSTSGPRTIRPGAFHVSRRQASLRVAAAYVGRSTPPSAPSRQQLAMSWFARQARPLARRRDRETFEQHLIETGKALAARAVKLVER